MGKGLNVIFLVACLSNEAILSKVEHLGYEIQVNCLSNMDKITSMPKFSEYADYVKGSNIDKGADYVIECCSVSENLKTLSNKEICCVIFYKREVIDYDEVITNIFSKDAAIRERANDFKYNEGQLSIFTSPVCSFKKEIYDKSAEIISRLESANVPVKELSVNYVFDGIPLDRTEESLVELGFNIRKVDE